MEKKRYRRTKYLVAKKFQLKYVGLILILMFLTAALCGYVVYYTSMLLMGEKLANVYPQGRLVSIVRLVNFRILLSLILVTPFVALIGIFLSHRIAGPINRIESFMNSVASGDLASHITLRRKDELVSLADGINYVVDNLREAVTQEKLHLNKVSTELNNLKKALESKPLDPSLLNNMINRLDNEASALNNVIGKYKL